MYNKDYLDETKYLLKTVHGIAFIEMLYWDWNEEKTKKIQKSKKLVIGKLGEPFFEPVDWIKKLMK